MKDKIDPGKVLKILDIAWFFDKQFGKIPVSGQKFGECFVPEMMQRFVVDAYQFFVVVIDQHNGSFTL